MTDFSLMALLSERGSRPIDLTNVMYRPLSHEQLVDLPPDPDLKTRLIYAGEVDVWARTSAGGWATEHEGLADFMFRFGRIVLNATEHLHILPN